VWFDAPSWHGVQYSRRGFGCFGSAMEVSKDLRLEKDSQTKESQMGWLDPADMFVQMRGIERKIKRII
jgi:hypothetical protein